MDKNVRELLIRASAVIETVASCQGAVVTKAMGSVLIDLVENIEAYLEEDGKNDAE